MEEDIKKRIRMMTGNKGDRILFDLDSGSHYVMDSKEEEKCPICLNHSFLMQTHHINKNSKDNRPENKMRICEFCHQQGIHNAGFEFAYFVNEKFNTAFEKLLEKTNNGYKFKASVTNDNWIKFMHKENNEYEEYRDILKDLIAIWHYERGKDTVLYKEGPSFNKPLNNKDRARQQSKKAKNILDNEKQDN